jgi:HlyD family secretion protein
MKNPFSKHPVLPILALFGLGFAFFSISAPPPELKTIEAFPVSVPEGHRIYGLGVIEPKNNISIISVQIPGIIKKVFVETGKKVKEGEPLMSLDSVEIDAKIQETEAKLNTAQIAAKESKAYVMNIQHKKATQVLKKDEVQRRYFSQALETSKVAQIQAELHFLKVQKDFHLVKAPFAGIVLEKNARVGEYAQIGGNRLLSPLISLADCEVLYVRAEFDEDFRDVLSQKPNAVGVLKGEKQITLALKFIQIEPIVKAKKLLSADAAERVDTRVLQVLYEIEKPKTSSVLLLPGMQIDVFIEDKSEKSKEVKKSKA